MNGRDDTSFWAAKPKSMSENEAMILRDLNAGHRAAIGNLGYQMVGGVVHQGWCTVVKGPNFQANVFPPDQTETWHWMPVPGANVEQAAAALARCRSLIPFSFEK